MNIYTLLAAMPHNPQYLNRYIKFINDCQQKNVGYTGKTEKHHICPQAKDMFPEYKSLRKHPWNKSVLTVRQHLLAHLLLVKVYPESNSQKYALWKMFQGRPELKKNTRVYARAREYNAELARERNQKDVAEGKHNWQGERNPSRIRALNGTHHSFDPAWRKEKSEQLKQLAEEGKHVWHGDKNPSVIKAKNGTHHWQGDGTHQRNLAKKLIEEGLHNWQGDGTQQKELNRKRIDDGTHNFLGMINCVDIDGNDVFIAKEEYDNQKIGATETWKYVHCNSKEGHRRKGIVYVSPRSNKEKTVKEKIVKEKKPQVDRNKGTKNGMYGKNHTEETKQAISKQRKGKKLSEEHKESIRKGQQAFLESEAGILSRQKQREKALSKRGNNFSGYYITPWGKFETIRMAIKACPVLIGRNVIRRWCNNSDQLIKSDSYNMSAYLRHLPLDKDVLLTMTYADLGFGFEEAESNRVI